MKIQVYNAQNELAYTSHNVAKVLFYVVARQHGCKPHKEALECVRMASEMWLKDENKTPLGELADYVSENYEDLIKLTNIFDRLQKFYRNL